MEKTETKLVVQTHFMGQWRDEAPFSVEEKQKAIAYMEAVVGIVPRRARIIERSERVIVETDKKT